VEGGIGPPSDELRRDQREMVGCFAHMFVILHIPESSKHTESIRVTSRIATDNTTKQMAIVTASTLSVLLLCNDTARSQTHSAGATYPIVSSATRGVIRLTTCVSHYTARPMSSTCPLRMLWPSRIASPGEMIM
jgi:hypothetical protein